MLVNNAGIPKRKPVQVLPADVVEDVMRINYFSPVRLTLALLPGLIERGGRIVFVSSVAARLSPPAEGAYAATKAAISAWAECMKVDLRDTEVGIHVVYPGVIDTELFHLPGNDPLPATGVEMLPVDAMVEPVLGAIETGRFEVERPRLVQQRLRRQVQGRRRVPRRHHRLRPQPTRVTASESELA